MPQFSRQSDTALRLHRWALVAIQLNMALKLMLTSKGPNIFRNFEAHHSGRDSATGYLDQIHPRNWIYCTLYVYFKKSFLLRG